MMFNTKDIDSYRNALFTLNRLLGKLEEQSDFEKRETITNDYQPKFRIIYDKFNKNLNTNLNNNNKLLDFEGNIEGGEAQLPKKLKQGEGSIRKRTRKNKNGSVSIFYEGRYMEDGEQKSVYAKTRPECVRKLYNAVHIENNEETVKKTVHYYTFAEWLDMWYETYKKPYLKPSSLTSIRTCIKKHISSELKKKKLNKITQMDLQQCLNSIEFPRQKDIVYQILCASLKQAKLNGLIKNEPWLGLAFKKSKSNTHNILTYEQETKILNDATPIMKKIITAYIWSGCRLNELLSLKWKDIDFEHQRLHIPGTKTDGSVRTIPLFDGFIKILNKPGDAEELVFPYKADWVSRQFHILVEKYGLKNVSIHSLRHTFASRMRALEVDAKSIQMMLGHSSIQTTMDIYVHKIDEYEQKVIEKVNNSTKSTLKKGEKYPKK